MRKKKTKNIWGSKKPGRVPKRIMKLKGARKVPRTKVGKW